MSRLPPKTTLALVPLRSVRDPHPLFLLLFYPVVAKLRVVKTPLYGCMKWSPNKPDYNRLRRVHHCMLLQCLGWRKRKRDDHTLSYVDAIAKIGSESIEAIVRKRRMTLFAGFLARMGEERLPQRVMFVWGACWG